MVRGSRCSGGSNFPEGEAISTGSSVAAPPSPALCRWIAGRYKVLAFWTISNLAVLCTYETSLALLQHIQT